MIEELKQLGRKFKNAISSARDEIVRLREQIDSHEREITRIDRAPLPLSDQESRLRETVAATGAAFLKEFRYEILGSNYALGSPHALRVRLPKEKLASWACLCASDPEAAVALVLNLVKKLEFEPGPSAAERPALIASLTRDLEQLEAIEETAVGDARANGLDMNHRPKVLQRRENEARARELEEREVERRRIRQAEIDKINAAPTRSNYLSS